MRSCDCCSLDHGGVMAELQSKLHLTSHPICLRVHGHSVYKDKDLRTWLHVIMETEGVLQVRLRQEDIPSGYFALSPSLLTSSTMPFMWMLYGDSQYVDSMCRFWGIVHHIKENGVEEMVLELIDNS